MKIFENQSLNVDHTSFKTGYFPKHKRMYCYYKGFISTVIKCIHKLIVNKKILAMQLRLIPSSPKFIGISVGIPL